MRSLNRLISLLLFWETGRVADDDDDGYDDDDCNDDDDEERRISITTLNKYVIAIGP